MTLFHCTGYKASTVVKKEDHARMWWDVSRCKRSRVWYIPGCRTQLLEGNEIHERGKCI